ncbi:MAG: hypothetical protein HY731_06585 [Candidatus Tectomicrobia bacterium]|nr:hypothetical protein [Candidatus Tectomicrobia bacterium]
MNENLYLGIILVVLSIVGLTAGLRLYQGRYSPHPEFVRKLMHMGSGLVALTLPWLFDRSWPVLFLSIVAFVVMLMGRYSREFKRCVGSAIGSVARESLGEVYFPLGIGLLFLFSRGDLLLYSIPLLILTFADAVAALVGVYYGVLRYTTAEGEKSVEGSAAFFLVAFFSAHIPLLLFTDTGRTESLLIALFLGLLLMIIEAAAWRGLDNLFIPTVGFFMLKASLEMSIVELAIHVAVTGILLIFVLLWHFKTTLKVQLEGHDV